LWKCAHLGSLRQLRIADEVEFPTPPRSLGPIAIAYNGVPFALAELKSLFAVAVSFALAIGEPTGILIFGRLPICIGGAKLHKGKRPSCRLPATIWPTCCDVSQFELMPSGSAIMLSRASYPPSSTRIGQQTADDTSGYNSILNHTGTHSALQIAFHSDVART
jgi:hypothetical protein